MAVVATPPHAWLRNHRYALLFATLLATIALGPLLEAVQFGRALIEVLLVANLLAAVLPMGGATQRRILYVLIAVAMVLRQLSDRMDSIALTMGGAAAWGIVAVIAAYRCVRYSLSSVKVNSERLCAALSAYLLLGVCWGVVYAAVTHLEHNTLLAGGTPLVGGASMAEAIYFSFVTLATLGYGDLTPVGPVMRGLVIFEAVVGQLYLAIMVARLVGLQTAQMQ